MAGLKIAIETGIPLLGASKYTFLSLQCLKENQIYIELLKTVITQMPYIASYMLSLSIVVGSSSYSALPCSTTLPAISINDRLKV